MFPKEMYVSKRCFKKHDGNISEIVSVGYSCMPIRYVFATFPDDPNEICTPQTGFENYILEEEKSRLWNICEDAGNAVFMAKASLNEWEQILYCELYKTNDLDCELYKTNDLDGINDFEFCGYDLLEAGASAIHDCNFTINKLNDFGLITTFVEAAEVDMRLRKEFPDDQHAHCEIYCVWRYVKRFDKI